MIRSFAAIVPEPQVRCRAAAVLEGLGDEVQLRLVPARNLHLTLAFLGEIPVARAQAAGAALAGAAAGSEPFELGLGGELVAVDKRRRVIAAAINGDLDRLENLQKRLWSALSDSGFPTSGREFRPHLTLARIHRNSSAAARRRILQKAGRQLAPLRLDFRVEAVGLYRSRLSATGASYSLLRRAELGRQGPPTAIGGSGSRSV